MIVFVFTGQAPLILLVALLILVYLTGLELWQEKDLPFLIKAWWVLARVPVPCVRLRRVQGLARDAETEHASTSREPGAGGRP